LGIKKQDAPSLKGARGFGEGVGTADIVEGAVGFINSPPTVITSRYKTERSLLTSLEDEHLRDIAPSLGREAQGDFKAIFLRRMKLEMIIFKYKILFKMS